MNASVAEVYNVVVDHRPEEVTCCQRIELSNDLSSSYCQQPSLVPASDSETSSLEDSCWEKSDHTTLCGASVGIVKPSKRGVTFDDRIQVREFALTVGDHPCCMGGLPLTLDWSHTEELVYKSLTECCAERRGRFKMPRKLDYEKRRERLFEVSTYSEQRVRNEEIDMVMNFLKSSWSEHTILPLPDFVVEDDDDSDDEEEKDCEIYVNPTKEQVVRWKRVVTRSESFME